MANNKSFVGVDSIYYAKITQDDSSAYAAGTPVALAPAMNIAQAPKTNSKTQYADNQPFDTMSSEGETEMDVEITGLPLDIQADILGRVYDAATGTMFDNGGTPPDIALGFRAKRRGGAYRYYWFLKGNFQTPSEEQASEADTPDPKSTKLKFVAIRTIKTFTLTAGGLIDSVKRVIADTSDAAFTTAATWFSNVRVPVVGSPSALTLTPVPVDNATGVSVSANQTLTFNNALNGNALHGIQLVRASDDSPVAASITIDATRKIITIDPTSNLSATTEHYIIVHGVTDIYGQVYADTVVSFTTA
jgi:phi13 family phage major tail protein